MNSMPLPATRSCTVEVARISPSAAARKIRLTEIESTFEADMDVRGCFGLDPEVRNGFKAIRATFRVNGDASDEKLRALVTHAEKRSAVFDMLTHGVPVSVDAVTA